MEKKILNSSSLEKNIKKLKIDKKKIVLCHGVFDLLHVGHLKHLEEAKKFGDILIVSITCDKFVNKGPGKPFFNEKKRLYAISTLQMVDYVILSQAQTAEEIIKKVKPDFYVKGPDYKKHKQDVTRQILKEMTQVKKFKGKTVFTKSEINSSSNLINKFLKKKSKNELKLIKKIKSRYNFESIKNNIDKIKKLKILIIGEIIIDEYSFCEALGKSGKEPVLVLKNLNNEKYIGGTGAICNNLKEFSNHISLLSYVGEKKEKLELINKFLKFCQKKIFLNKKNSPTITKKRFVDSINLNKILGVYDLNDETLQKKDEIKFNNYLNKMIPKYDLIIVSDYGHGLISKKSANILCKKSKYLALNLQINSSNYAYHNIKNYKSVNFLVLNEREIRHEFRDRESSLESLMKMVSKNKKINILLVTKGKSGCVLYNSKTKNFIYSDGYANKIIDKIGSGDAMLALTSACLRAGLTDELSILVGSLAAAQSVEMIANEKNISKMDLLRSLEYILK
jgi:rfaE bifunctional protein kinase chain/domain/rfaE bifunctional protein nucleotidyltransferase chain/domain